MSEYLLIACVFFSIVILLLILTWIVQRSSRIINAPVHSAMLVVLLAAYFLFAIIGCSAAPQEPVSAKLTQAISPSQSSISSAAPIPATTPTEVPQMFGLDADYSARIYSALQGWKEYSYNTNSPDSIDYTPATLETTSLEISISNSRLTYRSEIGRIGAIGNSVSDPTLVATLYSFPEHQAVDTQHVKDSYINFNGIQKGTYYYSVLCDGYITYFSPVYQISGEGDDASTTRISLITEAQYEYTKPFTIQLIHSNQDPIANAKVFIGASRGKKTTGTTYTSFITDQNGFVNRAYHTKDDEGLALILFSVSEGQELTITNEAHDHIAVFVPLGNQNNLVTIAE